MATRSILFLLLFFPFQVSGQLNPDRTLRQIDVKGKAHHSDAIIIQKDGEIVYEEYYGEEDIPRYMASAGKSLTGLAIGRLLYLGFIDSLDQPVYTLYPEWRQGRKKDITIRMLLNHTSGLQNYANASIELEPNEYVVENVIQLALCAELTTNPGETFAYNNKAVALLGGVVEKASGLPFDEFMIKYFYEPMGITSYGWIKDEAGNATTHGAFKLRGRDFMKFGELMLNQGVYDGQRYITRSYAQESVVPSQKLLKRNGLLWWLIPEFHKRLIDEEIIEEWKVAGVNAEFLKQLSPLFYTEFESNERFYSQLESTLGKDYLTILNKELNPELRWAKHIYSEENIGYMAEGYRGNYMFILPVYKVIALRLADHEGFDYENNDEFRTMKQLIIQWAKDQ